MFYFLITSYFKKTRTPCVTYKKEFQNQFNRGFITSDFLFEIFNRFLAMQFLFLRPEISTATAMTMSGSPKDYFWKKQARPPFPTIKNARSI